MGGVATCSKVMFEQHDPACRQTDHGKIPFAWFVRQHS
jgi:hypothetical protein